MSQFLFFACVGSSKFLCCIGLQTSWRTTTHHKINSKEAKPLHSGDQLLHERRGILEFACWMGNEQTNNATNINNSTAFTTNHVISSENDEEMSDPEEVTMVEEIDSTTKQDIQDTDQLRETSR